MPRFTVFAAAFLPLLFLFRQPAPSPSRCTRRRLTCLRRFRSAKHCISRKATPAATAPLITVDDAQRFQEIDGFGASLTDAAAWLFAKKLTPAQTDAAFKSLFARKDGIALSFLRQPVGSSDLAVTFYSFDDLCEQTAKACTTPPGQYGHRTSSTFRLRTIRSTFCRC